MHSCAPLCQAQLTGAEMQMHSHALIVICSRHCSVLLTGCRKVSRVTAVGRWTVCPLTGMRSAWLSVSYSPSLAPAQRLLRSGDP